MRELLRSVWAEPRAPGPPARAWRDWALVGVLVPLAILEGVFRSDLVTPVFSTVVALALVPTLLWRRTRPLLMVAIVFTTTGVAALFVGHEPELAAMVYVLLLPYALVRWGSGREAVAGAALILAKISLSVAVGHLGLADALSGLVVMVAVVALATALRYRARLWARGLDQAKLRERERLARDLHDTVAHHVSAMAIRAQAGIAVAQTRPDAAVDALRVIEAEATRALAEMRTMVRVLRRAQPADLAPSPGIPDIMRLAHRSPPGPVVDVQLHGDLDDIPATVGTAIYRLAQESVTNARRHARHATRIEVRVAAEPGSVRLRVSDDGDTSAIRPGAGGFGIVGMTERAGLLGGTCEAGPNPDRGWTVAVALPRAPAAA
ncbi:histidine kinase [Micromonospora sp. WMMD1082]|uniref:sensor histidine kinase n=1 Tax=Micromonospora sp. WMMD1082 TaxID=3016104 RepID=UPI0024163C3B|nr:histidine kinase [Micromonospora sp. WMMD1082]MDG4797108.1 histidine kinase [Micromonospora sp. WMMD1082]